MSAPSFEALPPIPTSIEIEGVTLELSPLKVGELPSFMRALRPLARDLEREIDWLTVFGERGDDVVTALAVAARRPREWVAGLPIDDAIRLAEAVFEVNADFFIRQVTPALLSLAERMGHLGQTFSIGSSASVTSTKPS